MRVPRDVFGGILTAWRDGYVAPLAAASGRDPTDVRADFDAMIADRPYAAARSVADALAELQRCSGSQFDPAVVEAFAAVVADRAEVRA